VVCDLLSTTIKKDAEKLFLRNLGHYFLLTFTLCQAYQLLPNDDVIHAEVC